MQTTPLNVLFRYEGIALPVPDHLRDNRAGLKAFHASMYPAIATADTHEIGREGDNFIVEYRRAVGTKG